jgi:hypothetical protein
LATQARAGVLKDAAKNFRDLRDFIYRQLVALSCVPQVEFNGVVTDQLDKRFFPAGTATKVLTPSRLERLFVSIFAVGQTTSPESSPERLAQSVDVRRLHIFLAILITSKVDLETMLSFIEKLVAKRQWSSLRAVLGDDVTADIFFQKQHDFLAPVIEKNREIRGHFRRLPYVREKLIGQGSFGKVYKVVVRSFPSCPTGVGGYTHAFRPNTIYPLTNN